MIIITLPLPPSSNKRVRPSLSPKTGKPTLFSTKKDDGYFNTVRRIFVMTLGKPAVASGPVRFHIDIWVPAYNYDSTNRLKTLEDALEALAYENDFQIISHRVERWLFNVHPAGLIAPMPLHPGVVVGIEQLERDDRTVPWFERFPATREAETPAPAARTSAAIVRRNDELATTPQQWAKRGLLKSGVIRFDK